MTSQGGDMPVNGIQLAALPILATPDLGHMPTAGWRLGCQGINEAAASLYAMRLLSLRGGMRSKPRLRCQPCVQWEVPLSECSPTGWTRIH